MNFIIDNIEEIPENLPVGHYNSKINSIGIEDGKMVMHVEFLGTKYDPNTPCLLPIERALTWSELVHPFVD